MEVTKLKVSRREATGSNAVNQLRKSGKTPAVLYGHKQEVVSLQADAKELSELLDAHAQFMELDIDGTVEPAIVREVQYDPFGQHIVHIDFIRVSSDEEVEVPVAIEIVGHAKGVTAGGVLEHHLMDLTVRCRPALIPAKIEVQVAELGLQESILVKDLVLPEGAVAVDDASKAVVAVVSAVVEASEATDGADDAEPEVIGGKPEGGP